MMIMVASIEIGSEVSQRATFEVIGWLFKTIFSP